MTITVAWHNTQQTVLYFHFSPHWTWDDLFAGWDQAEDMVRNHTGPVDYIMDARQSERVPNYSFAAVKRLSSPPELNDRLVVAVTSSVSLRRYYGLFLRMYPHMADRFHFKFVDTLAEAEALIARHSPDQSR